MSSLRVVTANVAGLNERRSRNKVLANLTKLADVVLLTETRCDSPAAARSWREEVELDGRWTARFTPSGTPYTGGTAILVRREMAEQMGEMRWDEGGLPEGRMTRLTCMWDGRTAAFVALYVPAKPNARRLFLAQLAALPADPSALVIAGGDFNCITRDEEMQAQMPYLKVGQQLAASWVERWGLADSWTGQARRPQGDPGWTKFTPSGTGSRIDRLYITAAARDRCTAVRTLGLSTSDHRAVLLTLGHRRKRTRWRLNTELLQHAPLRHRVVAAWRKRLGDVTHGRGSLQEAWTGFKADAAALCADFGKGQARRRRAARVAAELQLRSARTQEERAEAKATLQQLEEYEEQGRLARLGVEATYADRPTAEFFRRMAEPTEKLDVRALTVAGGAVITEPAAITDAVSALWRDVYGAGHAAEALTPEVEAARARSLARLHRRLGPAEAAKLVAPYTEQELLAALKSLPTGASPGNDGLPPAFYITFWKVVGKPLAHMLNVAVAGGALPGASLQARIILLPKTAADAPRASDFRPISLLNTEYKIWAKAVSRRLAGVMQHICSPRQTGFVPGRSILHNITFNRDLLEYMREDRGGAVMAFLDFEKAFDRVNWTYRDAVLRTLGIPEPMLRTINAFYSGAASQLELNGSTGSWFHPTRGVRQGCPLSPLLFALFAEPLGALLDDMGNGREGEATGIALPLTHRQASSARIGGSQYADDTVVYCCTVAALERTLGEVESEFCLASGARLNRDKTRILPVGQHVQLPAMVAGARVLQEEDRVKSLGAMYSRRANAPGRLPEVLAKMRRRLTRLLQLAPSLLGRAQVANALLSSCLWYYCTFEALQPEDAKAASTMLWECLWGSAERRAQAQQEGREQRIRGMVSRGRAAAPRLCGGLNLIEPAAMVKALHARAVNLMLQGRGQWWTTFSEALLERAARTGPGTGADGLALVEARSAIANNCPPYWKAALSAWAELGLAHPPQLTGTMVTLRARATAPPQLHQGLDLLAACRIQYLRDIWDWAAGQPVFAQPILQCTAAARRDAGLAETAAISAYKAVRDSVTQDERSAMRHAVAAGGLYRVRGAALSVQATSVGELHSSGCSSCSARRAVQTRPTEPSSGRGAVSVAAAAAEQTLCACRLSPLLTNADRTVAWGEAETTALIPSLLAQGEELSVESSVAELRVLYRDRMHSESAARPECEAAWEPHLSQPLPCEEEWQQLWQAVHAAEGNGKATSTMWKVLHRRPYLLTLRWRRERVGGSSACRMCDSGEEETLEHLFSSCPTAEATWARVQPWLSAVGLGAAVASVEGRLVGRVRPHWPTVAARWPAEPEMQEAEVMEKWFRVAWAEVRAVVLHALWVARCNVVMGGARREGATAAARAVMRWQLQYLLYRHVPKRCPWQLPSRGKQPSPERSAFLALFWSAFEQHMQ